MHEPLFVRTSLFCDLTLRQAQGERIEEFLTYSSFYQLLFLLLPLRLALFLGALGAGDVAAVVGSGVGGAANFALQAGGAARRAGTRGGMIAIPTCSCHDYLCLLKRYGYAVAMPGESIARHVHKSRHPCVDLDGGRWR